MIFCSQCGKQLNEGAKFCSGCGTQIIQEVINEQQQQQQQQHSAVPPLNQYYSSPQNPNIQVSGPTGKEGKASASLVLGGISLAAWIIPFIGLPVAIIGMALGSAGTNSALADKARKGIKFSIIGLVLSIVNLIFGVILFSY